MRPFRSRDFPRIPAITLYFYTSQSLPDLTVTSGATQTFVATGVFTTSNTKEFTVTTDSLGSPITGGFTGTHTNVLSGLTIAIPEPSSIVLLTLGIAGVIGYGCFQQRRTRA